MTVGMDYGLGFVILLFTSMTLQVILSVFGSFRKRCSNKWFTFLLWSAYQLADVVATTALSLITNHSNDLDAFWSAFLLWHLGGPDSITALALVDNQLFRRHSVQLVYLVGVAGYVLVKQYLGYKASVSAINWIEPMLVFLAGISKYGEKVWALHSADMASLRDSMFPPPNQGPNLEISSDDDDDQNNVADAGSISVPIPMDEYVFQVTMAGAMVPAEGTCNRDSTLPPNLGQGQGQGQGQGPGLLNFNEDDDDDDDDDDCVDANDAQSIPMPTPKPKPKPMDESASRRSLKEQLDSHQKILLQGHHYFCNFRCLFVDIMVPNSHILDSRRFFLQYHCEIAFQLIDVELRFVYDMLFTKAPVVRTWLGYSLRLLRLSILLEFLIRNGYFSEVGLVLLFHPIPWALVQEMYEVTQMLLLEWTVVWLNNHNFNRLSMIILRLVLMCRLLVSKIICFCSCGVKPTSEKTTIWWYYNSMAQYNLLSLCFKDDAPTITMFKRLLYLPSWGKSIREWVEKSRNTTYMHVPSGIKDFIHQQLVHIADEEIKNAEFRNPRGKWVMRRNSCLEELGWSVDYEFDQSILIWHVATDLCYYYDDLGSDKCEATTLDLEVQVSKALSNYLLYLMLIFPFMLNSRIGKIGFQDTCKTIKKLLYAIKNKRHEKSKPFSFSLQRKYIMRLLRSDARVRVEESKSDESKSVLLEACRLARLLLSHAGEERWKIISGVWVEMLSYAARNCSGKHHAERLCDGGEFLTKIWLLMAHLGMVE